MRLLLFFVLFLTDQSSIGTAMGKHFSVWRAWKYGRVYGVTQEVRLHRLVMGENGFREARKNPIVGNARRGIRICYCRRGDVGGKAPTL